MFTITKDFHFSAGHIIEGLPEGHKCGRDHGHDYIVRLFLQSEHLDKIGFVVDFGELNEFKKWIDDVYDHRNLNEVMGGMPTTAEWIAREFYVWTKSRWLQIVKVGVREGQAAWAFYEEST